LKEANPNFEIKPLNPTVSEELVIPTGNKQENTIFDTFGNFFDSLMVEKTNLLLTRLKLKIMNFLQEILNNIIPPEYFIYLYWLFIIIIVYIVVKIAIFVVKVVIFELTWIFRGFHKIMNFLGYKFEKNGTKVGNSPIPPRSLHLVKTKNRFRKFYKNGQK
jgi:hypothetical protein